MKTAIVPGSFDPMTLGHVDIVRRAAAMFDRVVVAVMVNPDKEYMLSREERLTLARLSCAHIPGVEVILDEGMLIDLFDRLDACVIVKGVRTVKDFRYEQTMAYWNKSHNPKAETLYLPADPRLSRLSSTVVRRRIEEGRPLDGLLAPAALSKLVEWGRTCPPKK